ncbi:MAG: S1C family serine protease [Ilumatobacteraceae bacterium]
MIETIESTIRTVASAAGPSIVSIGRNGRGTGFVVGQDRVLTSAHNLRDQTVAITFADGRTEQASVHGVDADGDVVVVSVPTGELPALSFAEVTLEVGGAVVALSRGGHRARVTLGFISAQDQAFRGPRGRVVHGSIEHTAPLARGSSGGPVCNAAGHVVGINTHRAGDGFYLARATDAALQTRIAELLDGRSPQRRTLGVAIAPPQVATELRQAVGLSDRTGLLVRGVEESGPAAAAGVLVGDLLVLLGDTELISIDALADGLARLATDTVELGVVRGADDLSLTVSFA